ATFQELTVYKCAFPGCKEPASLSCFRIVYHYRVAHLNMLPNDATRIPLNEQEAQKHIIVKKVPWNSNTKERFILLKSQGKITGEIPNIPVSTSGQSYNSSNAVQNSNIIVLDQTQPFQNQSTNHGYSQSQQVNIAPIVVGASSTMRQVTMVSNPQGYTMRQF